MRTPVGYRHEYRDAEGQEWISLGDISRDDWAEAKGRVDDANRDAGFYHQRLTPIYEKAEKRSRSRDI